MRGLDIAKLHHIIADFLTVKNIFEILEYVRVARTVDRFNVKALGLNLHRSEI